MEPMIIGAGKFNAHPCPNCERIATHSEYCFACQGLVDKHESKIAELEERCKKLKERYNVGIDCSACTYSEDGRQVDYSNHCFDCCDKCKSEFEPVTKKDK